jgi:hypothetical protein
MDIGIADVANISDLFGNGASASDYDNDGDIDFYLCTDAFIKDRLYRNNGKGIFEDIANQVGIDETKSSRASLWFDYDGDGLLDLLVAGERCVNLICEDQITLSLYKQKSDHTFINTTLTSGLKIGLGPLTFYGVGGLCAGDLNQDNFLDFVLTVWGGDMLVFYNNKDGTFRNATIESGIYSEQTNYWQPMIHDFNDDGLLDLYVNVDFAANELWINKNGKFENQAFQYGLDHSFNEMGMAIGDIDNDSDMDIYVTNITRNFLGDNQHNILYQKTKLNGSIFYKEIAQNVGVDKSGWDWGTTFIDINNDGYQDLATTNGWNDPLWKTDYSHLWMNSPVGFVDVSEKCMLNDGNSGTTLISFDMDRDGDLDMLQTLKDMPNSFKPAIMYENKLDRNESNHNYVVIKPRMDGTNHFAIGSVVTVKTGGTSRSRLISAGTSFYGQEPAEAFIGLGNLTKIDEVQIKWPTNEVSSYKNVAINKVNTLDYEGSNFITSTQMNEANKETFIVNIQNPLENEIKFIFASEKNGAIRASLYDLAGHMLVNRNFTKTERAQEFILNRHCNPGVFFLKFQFGENIVVKKVTIIN